MAGTEPDGTQGYSAEADALIEQYESISFNHIHAQFMHLLPEAPARILDIGAGTGRDAAGFALLGYSVTAVEPTIALRSRARQIHPSPDIEWLDDRLPDLLALAQSDQTYRVVMLTAVWMHLDEAQRRRAMARVATLIRPRGVVMISLRHGPVPHGRRMFEVTASETIELASIHGLLLLEHIAAGDGLLKRPGVTWDRLAFRRQESSCAGSIGR